MAVPASDLELGTLAGDDALLERLLFEAITETEGDEIVPGVVRLHALADLLGESHHYADLLLSARLAAKPVPVLLSTIKLRQAGFAGCRDSLEALLGWLDRMVELRLLPGVIRGLIG